MVSPAPTTWVIPYDSIDLKTQRLSPAFWKQVLSFNTAHGLEALQNLLGLSPATFSIPIINNLALDYTDPVFVAINTEGDRHDILELGISILDTRTLHSLNPNDDLSTALSTFNYTTWKQETKYWVQWHSVFRFGQTKYIADKWVGWLLGHVLRTGSIDATYREPRNTILVGHGISGDLGRLTWRRTGKFLLRNFPNLLILDTQIIAEPMFEPRRKLELLGKYLSVDCHGVYNAGNDANSTMKLLLMLAIGKMDKSGLGAELKGRMELLKKIAKAPSERLPRHIEHMALGMEEPVSVKLPVEEAVDQVEDWYNLWDTLTKLYVEE
jgi:hypothetical protein